MGGIAEYFNMDPLHVRIAWWAFVILTTLAAGAIAYALVPTVLTLLAVAYLVAYLLMSEAPAELSFKELRKNYSSSTFAFSLAAITFSAASRGISS